MSLRRAPTASLRPISRVRSVTETSMMFMMLMPPTTSDTEAIAASSQAIVVVEARCAAIAAAGLLTWKSLRHRRPSGGVGAAAPRSGLAPSARLVRHRLDEDVGHGLAVDLAGAAHEAELRGRDRHEHDVVLVLPGARRPLLGEHADDLERHARDADLAPDRVVLVEQLLGDGGPDQRHLAGALLLGARERAP